ncbi:MAG TPA: T9SS C-terminal target domain-containing protein, partial [Flavobacteriales bacterium]|nr:T9SS C-terminal target domain-containing protein [Flavobacteriales bacterium]
MKLRLFIIAGTISLISMLDVTPAMAEKHPLGKAEKTTEDVKGQSQAKKSGGQSILAGCAEPNEKNFIEFNNVKALIHTGGDMFWDFGTGDASYEVPKGSNKHSMFLSSLWLGGTDVNGQLRIAAQRYRGGGVDFWTGPLDTGGTAEISPEACAEWDKHFIISRAEVDQFVAWYNDPSSVEAGYTVPKSIIEWPAHGDAAAGQSYYLAPFFDYNGDGFYNPEDGDYPFYDLSANTECNRSRDREPKLFGDKTMWFVFNDKGNVHNETEGDAIGLEVHAQEFAFATNDEINNMTFTNYRIINRSTFTLIDTYFGTNFDPDIGDYQDDYVGCDVKRGLGYGYNGPAIDGSGAFNHYGENPPAIGVDFFEGPFQDPDNLDNPKDSACDAYMNGSINGLNFGDGEVDNERWGMRRLVFYCNPGVSGCDGATQGDPSTAVDYYSYLRGYWRDGTRMRYGGNGHISNCTSCEYADFM